MKRIFLVQEAQEVLQITWILKDLLEIQAGHHLDIAGVTWSKKGTSFARPGGTGFGVRLLDEFIKS